MAIAANFPTVRPSLLLDFSNQTVLDPRVTFARTTTALYYDNKSAALAEQNLLTYSNTFTNAYWVKTGVGAPVLNATDPAGTASGAYTVTATVGSNAHCFVAGAVAGSALTYTASCYFQAGTNNFASLSVSSNVSTTWSTATYNLSTGGLTQQQSGSSGVFTIIGTPTITQIGSTSWYRCVLVFTVSSAVNLYAAIMLNSVATPTIGSSGIETWTALGTETLLVYGIQLEQRSSATVYTATTATAVNTYTPTLQSAAINAPRFDYNPTTRESLGLLFEQASTNLALYSSDYTNAAWIKTGSSITATADISPDGTQNASLLVCSTVSTNHLVYQSITPTAGSNTFSVYLKYYGLQFVQIYHNNVSNKFCNFDLINGTAGTPSASTTANIQNVGNGWYRCSITATVTAVSATFVVHASNSLTATIAPTFAGNGFNGYLIWGAQVEAAPSATSYIATVASAQTRTVDSASMTGTNFTSWYNYSGGTVYVEAASGNPTAADTPYAFTISDNTTNNQIAVYYTAVGVQTFAKANNVSLQTLNVALPSAAVANTFYKTAWYYSNLTTVGNGVSSVGQTATTYATAINVPAVTQINFATSGSANLINGRIKKFAYYPAVLTNTQIQSLSAN